MCVSNHLNVLLEEPLHRSCPRGRYQSGFQGVFKAAFRAFLRLAVVGSAGSGFVAFHLSIHADCSLSLTSALGPHACSPRQLLSLLATPVAIDGNMSTKLARRIVGTCVGRSLEMATALISHVLSVGLSFGGRQVCGFRAPASSDLERTDRQGRPPQVLQ